MGVFEEKQRREERLPLWRSSEGRMWEAAPAAQKEGQDHLTGYEPREEERSARPREAARMAGSYGDVSVGVSRKKELTLVVSKRRSREGPAALREEQTLLGNSARKMNMARGDFQVNAHDPQKSAVAYRESHQKTPGFMLQRFREMMGTREQDTLAEQVPFLDRQEEREALRRLQSLQENLLARGGSGRAILGRIEARKQALRQSLTEKEAQERRLRLLLQKAQEESRRRAGETERLEWQPGAVAEELPLPEGDGQENPAPEDGADAAPAPSGPEEPGEEQGGEGAEDEPEAK